jgi:aryl-alcohol dehydrogenase-like predicted oxidoreductase
MGLTAFYGGKAFDRTKAESSNLETIKAALNAGINFFDTAWIYQSFGADGNPNTTNEELLGKAIKMYGRDRFIIATKTGIAPSANGLQALASEAVIRQQLNDSLTRLGTDYIDLYYCHRMPTDVTIEGEFVSQSV